jgi:hypothetical protein
LPARLNVTPSPDSRGAPASLAYAACGVQPLTAMTYKPKMTADISESFFPSLPSRCPGRQVLAWLPPF